MPLSTAGDAVARTPSASFHFCAPDSRSTAERLPSVARDIGDSTGDCGRGNDLPAGLEFPFDLVELRGADRVIDVKGCGSTVNRALCGFANLITVWNISIRRGSNCLSHSESDIPLGRTPSQISTSRTPRDSASSISFFNPSSVP